MGKVIPFPGSTISGGIVHVYAFGNGYEIGHESASGDSWGGFEQFDCAQTAVAAAYRLNRDVYGGGCCVDLHADVLAALPDTPAPDRGEFE